MNNSINILTEKFNKKYVIPVYSGTLAIETILKSLKLPKSARVLISSTVCYSILQAIINSNLKPVIAIPNNGVTLSKDELERIIKKEKIDVFIAVHQYGYFQEIPNIKRLIIIEDISQSWDIHNSKTKNKSDYIITSLGSTKPLNNGIGGLIMTNKKIGNLDYKNKDSRRSKKILLEYYYDQPIDYKRLIHNADRKIKNQKNNAQILNKVFKDIKGIKPLDQSNDSSYHRYVLEINDSIYDRFLDILNKTNINYQREYKIQLSELPIVKELKIKVIGKKTSNFILIRSDNKQKSIKELKRELSDLNGEEFEDNVY